MSTAAILRVKDEADVIEATVRHLLAQVDAAIVADNASTDGTLEILEGFIGDEGDSRVSLIRDPEVGYYQSRAMTALAAHARERGFAWVVPCDADEVWYANGTRIGDWLSELPADVAIVTAELYDHVATADDPPAQELYPAMMTPEGPAGAVGCVRFLDPFKRIGWRRREPAKLQKVACRLLPGLVIQQGNHSASYPGEHVGIAGGLVVRHFPYRSVPQFVHKVRVGAAAYAATDLPPFIGAHWRQYGELLASGGEAAIEEIFRTWFWSTDPASDPSLIYDPAPVSR